MFSTSERCSWLSWKWSIVAAAFGAYFLADGCSYSFTILYSEFLHVFHQSAAQTAFVPALLMGLPLLTGFLVTPIVDSVGPDVATLIAMTLLFVSFFASSFSQTLTLISVNIALLSAAGLQLTYVSALLSVTQAFPETNPDISTSSVSQRRQRGLALGITTAGSGVGVMLFGPFMVHGLEVYTWRGAMLLESALFLHLAVIAIVYRQLYWRSHDHHHSSRPPPAVLQVPTHGDDAVILPILSVDVEQKDLISKQDMLQLLPLLENSGVISSQHNRSVTLLSDLAAPTGECIQVLGSSDFVKSNQLRGSFPTITNCDSPHRTDSLSLSKSNLSENPQTATITPIDSRYQHGCPQFLITCWSRLTESVSEYRKRLLTSMKGMLSRELWSNVSFLVFVVADALVAGGFTIYWTFAYDQALRLGLTPHHASIMFSLMGACSTSNELVWGSLAGVGPPLLVWLIVRVLGCVGISMLALPHSVWSYTVLTCLTACCYNVSLFPQNLLMLVGERLSYAAMGLYLTTMGIAVLAAPPIAGHLVDMYQSYSPALLLGGCALGSGVLLIVAMTLGECILAGRHWRALSLFQFSARQT